MRYLVILWVVGLLAGLVVGDRGIHSSIPGLFFIRIYHL